MALTGEGGAILAPQPQLAAVQSDTGGHTLAGEAGEFLQQLQAMAGVLWHKGPGRERTGTAAIATRCSSTCSKTKSSSNPALRTSCTPCLIRTVMDGPHVGHFSAAFYTPYLLP